MIDKYKEIYKQLINIQRNLENEIIDINKQKNNFNKRLIELITQYPDFKEIIQFILEVYDASENKNNLYHQTHDDCLRKILDLKKDFLEILSEQEINLQETLEDLENKSTNNYSNNSSYNEIPIGMPMSIPPTPTTNDEVTVIPNTETLYQITINKLKEIPAKYILFFIGLVFICITILIRPQEVSDLSKAIIPSVTHIQKQNLDKLDSDTTTQSDSSLPKLPTLKDEQ
jgi:hypothetical protein